jgi:precorrin-6A/cobalt-precorrin-6A reductase
VDGPGRVLILGGTTEAAALARRLVAGGWAVTTSLAGRTSRPAPLPGAVRVGGFGGIDGLVAFLGAASFAAVVDATHPFAAHMPHHAAAACSQVGVPRVRLLRPGWTARPGDRWRRVPDLVAAARSLADSGARRVFLTTGRQELAPFAPLVDVWFLVRAIEPPDPMPLSRATVVLDRGPFLVGSERMLMERHAIDTVVTKDSGGTATAAKLTAARELAVPVVVVDRPPAPEGPTVATVEEAVDWLEAPRKPFPQNAFLDTPDGPQYRRGV